MRAMLFSVLVLCLPMAARADDARYADAMKARQVWADCVGHEAVRRACWSTRSAASPGRRELGTEGVLS